MSSTTGTAARAARKKRAKERARQDAPQPTLEVLARAERERRARADEVALAGRAVILCAGCETPVLASRPRAGVLCPECARPAALRPRSTPLNDSLGPAIRSALAVSR
ncbi:hypothetical protein [Isoptericola dokdonensis]|uniref:Uncharacterized protein n=1 Tax=Isoptericola dokdonensis DS-3 TaxID=1300344 RepID=A0A161IGW5_9MICO|nr:hypothetical protein [Isoptericola dokdonensis]ANC30844.1 hypothetical protein I598_1284 [Isoptericola dokdonensis DS-3]